MITNDNNVSKSRLSDLVAKRRAEKVKHKKLTASVDEVNHPIELLDFESIDRMRILDKINFNHNYGFTASGEKALPVPPSKILGLEP